MISLSFIDEIDGDMTCVCVCFGLSEVVSGRHSPGEGEPSRRFQERVRCFFPDRICQLASIGTRIKGPKSFFLHLFLTICVLRLTRVRAQPQASMSVSLVCLVHVAALLFFWLKSARSDLLCGYDTLARDQGCVQPTKTHVLTPTAKRTTRLKRKSAPSLAVSDR